MKSLIPLSVAFAFAIAGSQAQEKPREVKTEVLKLRATVEPVQVAEVSANTAGFVQTINVDLSKSDGGGFGVSVKKGDVLAKLDSSLYETALSQTMAELAKAEAGLKLAQAKVMLAERDYERLKQLSNMGAVARSELDASLTNLDIAKATTKMEEASLNANKAALDRAKLMLSYCTITSPIDGTIISHRCAVGQAVGKAGEQPLFIIANLKTVKVIATLPQADIAKVAKGQSAQFSLHAYPDTTLRGEVAAIRLVPPTKSAAAFYQVEILAENRDGKMLPYLTADVSIDITKR
jgi:HlyD family secretion protein